MRTTTLLIALAAITLAAVPASAQYSWHYYNGHEYAVTQLWQPWMLNEAEAISVGGHLVSINDEAENTWLATTFAGTSMADPVANPDSDGAQIGYYLNQVSGQWEWISGEPVTFTKRGYDFATNNGGYAYMSLPPCIFAPDWGADPGHTLPGRPQGGYLKGIIERPVPEPSSLAALAFGVIGMGGGMVRRRWA